jgi:hypothetical protein
MVWISQIPEGSKSGGKELTRTQKEEMVQVLCYKPEGHKFESK